MGLSCPWVGSLHSIVPMPRGALTCARNHSSISPATYNHERLNECMLASSYHRSSIWRRNSRASNGSMPWKQLNPYNCIWVECDGGKSATSLLIMFIGYSNQYWEAYHVHPRIKLVSDGNLPGRLLLSSTMGYIEVLSYQAVEPRTVLFSR
ncbi:uncharacterized protein LY79DRAFT_64438 [Colletotrichum navitas]|uniref:Uncharacterized protein n=1 Tax=Colletotrichum navitas TaxID=681940 RepID=A0AAD8V6U2_9PEZI|nr:uncharacterized protein LY79DRAFT_64438 [Colletotrichum navitas]KAK1596417.1 hypothetical protein LY79DRAFT_64438 [Colletotrichum navitas]